MKTPGPETPMSKSAAYLRWHTKAGRACAQVVHQQYKGQVCSWARGETER